MEEGTYPEVCKLLGKSLIWSRPFSSQEFDCLLIETLDPEVGS